MKIGEFAEKYDLKISTVRYYVEHALLTPERKNNQYIFNRSCMEDMEKILKYKSYHFTLEEIELFFFLEKASKFRDEKTMKTCMDLLHQKLNQLETEDQRLRQTIENLKDEIESFDLLQRKMDTNRENTDGIPLSFIENLCCPRCRASMRLEAASISNGKISEGDIPLQLRI